MSSTLVANTNKVGRGASGFSPNRPNRVFPDVCMTRMTGGDSVGGVSARVSEGRKESQPITTYAYRSNYLYSISSVRILMLSLVIRLDELLHDRSMNVGEPIISALELIG